MDQNSTVTCEIPSFFLLHFFPSFPATGLSRGLFFLNQQVFRGLCFSTLDIIQNDCKYDRKGGC